MTHRGTLVWLEQERSLTAREVMRDFAAKYFDEPRSPGRLYPEGRFRLVGGTSLYRVQVEPDSQGVAIYRLDD